MKKITFRLFLFASLLITAGLAKAQTCTAAFTYSTLPNGGVVFFSTSTPANSITSQYYWNFGNSTTYTATGSPTAGTTYTANGSYTVSLFFLNPNTCSNVATSVITITNVSSGGCNLNASIGWASTSGGYFFFSNSSTGTTSNTTYFWNFGDNSTSTSSTGIGHTYSSNGTYTVTLYANNNTTPACVDSVSAVITVSTVCSLNAGFTYTVSGGNVFVTNVTTPSTSTTYSWNASNGQTFTTKNPVFTFTANGTYTILLYAHTNNPPCNSAVAQTINITNSSTCNINASFIYTKLQNGLVSFTSTCVGTNSNTTYTWNFGDSNTSTQVNPYHTYASNGSYVVTLTASNGGTCTSTTTMTVNITNLCSLAASFGYTVGSNGVVNFANTSTGTQTNYIYNWNFGDQSTGSGTSPNHTYLNGTYVVVLTVSNSSVSPTCTSVATQTINVSTSTCVANAGFSVVPTSTAQYWNAYPLSGSNVANAIWNWGDNSSSNTLYTSHQYSAAGTYDLCLSVTLTCGASDTYCAPYSIYRTSGNNDVIYVNVIDPATVGLNEQLSGTKMSVFPNPTTGVFNIQFVQKTSGNATASLYNVTGARVQVITVAEGTHEINVDGSALPTGVYFLKLETQNKGTVVQKIVVDR